MLRILIAYATKTGSTAHCADSVSYTHLLGCTDRPILTVFNKCDRLENGEDLLPGEDRAALRISAKTGEGISALLEAVAAALPPDRRRVRLLLPFREGALAELCRREGAVEAEEYRPEGLFMVVTLGCLLYTSRCV